MVDAGGGSAATVNPHSLPKRENGLTVVASVSYLIFAAMLIASVFWDSWVRWAVLSAVLVLATVSMALLPVDLRNRLLNQWWLLTGKIMSICAVIGLPALLYTLIRWVSEISTFSIRVIGLASFVVFLLLIALSIGSDRARKAFLKATPGSWVPIAYSASAVIFAAAIFGAGTMEMVAGGWIVLEPAPSNAGQIADFYMWHLINALPGNLLGALQIDPPFAYTSKFIGLLIITFNLTIVVPAIALIRASLKERQVRSASPQT